MAYEMIVMAFADGDRKTLKNLLSPEVYDGFDAAIADREAKGEKVKSTFVGIDKAEITNAEVKGSEAQMTLRISSQLISATYDKDEKLIDGNAEDVAEVNDIWTFARDTRSRDPNWKLVATESEHE
jgi:predicted lipid-binding transport protein (Tim44 family)